jgi:cytochrome c oxidase subunit 4
VSDSQHQIGLQQYFAVFGALMTLTALTVWVAFQNFGWLNNVLAVGIAVVKSTLVILWFMHVRQSSRLTKSLIIVAMFFFLALVSFVLADSYTRGMLTIPGRPPVIAA